jgi:hypothetical protein
MKPTERLKYPENHSSIGRKHDPYTRNPDTNPNPDPDRGGPPIRAVESRTH